MNIIWNYGLMSSGNARTPTDQQKAQTLAIIRGLPPGTDPNFGLAVRSQLSHLDMNILQAIVDHPENNDAKLRFAAFYSWQVKLRRAHRYKEHQQNIEKFRSAFHDEPMFKFMLAEFYGDTTGDQGARDLAIRFARDACDALPQTPGVHHLLAEYLLESVELSVTESSQDVRISQLLEAETHAGMAISLSRGEYPKFYATHARIQSQLGLEDAALKSINIAIAGENAEGEEGRARVIGYQVTRREIANARSARLFRLEQEKAVVEFRALRSELLSLLGLLAAVVAFISTFTGIATNTRFPDNVFLMLTSASVLLMVFLGFSSLFVKRVQLRQVLIVGGMSVALLGGAFLFRLVL